MGRGTAILTGAICVLALAGCDASSPAVPAEIVDVPPNACVAPSKRTCNSDQLFVKKEWLSSDCKKLPIGGLDFDRCSVSKIYRFLSPGRGTADMQSYGGILPGPQQSVSASYTKEIAGRTAGVVPADEATLMKELQGGSEPGSVVGRMGDDFEVVTEQRMITHGKVISHTADTFIYAFDSGIDHCKAFLSYGPAEWPGTLRLSVAAATICNHIGGEVGLDQITKLQSQLVFR